MRHSSGAPVRHRASRSGARRAVAPGATAASGAAAPPSRRRAAARRNRGRQVPYWIAVIGMVVALALTREHAFGVRGGTLALAGIVLAAALARLALPERRAGMLVSRRRLVDVPILTALGVGLLVAGLVLPAQP
jgi:Protein of unknown function (DUF3017)